MIKIKYKRVYIEISNICNLKCEFCSPLLRQKQTMTIPSFEHIISEIKPHTDFVYFHVKGEPLLHPNLKEFLDICLKNNIRVNITTNGTLLNEKMDLLLNHKAVRQVNISLHSFKAQDKINNDDYINTAISFAKKANEKGIYVVLRLWNLDNQNNADNKSLNIMKQIADEFSYDEPIEQKLNQTNSVKIANSVYIGWEKEFVWPTIKNDFVSDSGYCYGMRHQIAILVDGTVVPCCLDANAEASIGNIFDESFIDIINSKTAKQIRHGFENNVAYHELCKHCSFRTKFDKYMT